MTLLIDVDMIKNIPVSDEEQRIHETLGNKALHACNTETSHKPKFGFEVNRCRAFRRKRLREVRRECFREEKQDTSPPSEAIHKGGVR